MLNWLCPFWHLSPSQISLIDINSRQEWIKWWYILATIRISLYSRIMNAFDLDLLAPLQVKVFCYPLSLLLLHVHIILYLSLQLTLWQLHRLAGAEVGVCGIWSQGWRKMLIGMPSSSERGQIWAAFSDVFGSPEPWRVKSLAWFLLFVEQY